MRTPKFATTVLTAAATLVLGAGLVASVPASAAGTAPSLHVSGNHLVDASGNTVTLHGVNRSGGEFACVQGYGIWDGAMDQASVAAIKSWNVNAVRVPVNEACWNAESYVDSAYSGATYQQAVKDYVNLLNSNGIVAIIDLHWTDGVYTGTSSACTSAQAVCQKPMPDAAQAVPFWTSVANTFKGNDSVLFDLFNEPYPERATGNETTGWQCWRDGGTCAGIGYQVAGMQSMVNAVRGTGADNVIMLGGLAYSNDLTQWLTYKPSDPDNNLVASHHSYNFNTCASQSCWDSQLAPVANQVPLVVGELGENDCAHGYIDTLMAWLDGHGVGYLAWTWNNWDCSSGPSLVSDYTGTPTAYGQGYKDHLSSLASDTTAPSAPSNLTVTGTTATSASLSWSAATDNVGVAGYRLYRNGSQVGTTTGTSFTDTGLTASTAYTYTVRAVDAAGNVSAASGGVTATTPATGGGGSSGCTASYHVDNDWGSGFTATITVANPGSTATNAWTVAWVWGGSQQVTNAWNATLTQSSTSVTVKNAGYNGALSAGASTSFGLQASYTGSNAAPALACTAT